MGLIRYVRGAVAARWFQSAWETSYVHACTTRAFRIVELISSRKQAQWPPNLAARLFRLLSAYPENSSLYSHQKGSYNPAAQAGMEVSRHWCRHRSRALSGLSKLQQTCQKGRGARLLSYQSYPRPSQGHHTPWRASRWALDQIGRVSRCYRRSACAFPRAAPHHSPSNFYMEGPAWSHTPKEAVAIECPCF